MWIEPTPGAALPGTDTVGALAAFADAQTGQLDLANVTKAGMVEILTNCEKRDAETVAALTKRKRILGIF